MSAQIMGAFLFGAVLGYVTHYLVRRDAAPGVSDLAAIVGVIIGGTVFKVIVGESATSWYLIGLGAGFFLYWLALMLGREPAAKGVQIATRKLTLFPFLN
jgi:hypothetical protein